MKDDYLHSLLGANEQVLLMTRQHWLVLIGEILTETVLSIAVIGLVSLIWILWIPNPLVALGFLLLVLPLASLLRDVLTWSNRQYVVTSRRVIHLEGVFNKEVTDSSLEKVNDVKMEQSWLGRLLDFGNLEILTASELGVNKFALIERPVRLKTAMLNAKNELEHGPTPVAAGPAESEPDVLALIAQLDDLRQKGILTEAEFQSKKAALLAKL